MLILEKYFEINKYGQNIRCKLYYCKGVTIKKRVLTHTHITKEIWGSSLEGDIASLRVHVATVRKKIEKKDSLNKCIQTHVGIGYCMVKQE